MFTISHSRFLTPTFALALAFPSSVAFAQTDTTSINWKQFGGAVNDALDGYGVEPANNWLNLEQVIEVTDAPLSSGGTSTIDITGLVPGGYDTWNFGTLNNTPMRAGISSFSTGTELVISDINATFSSYELIVYLSGFNAVGNQGSISDGATTYVYTVPSPYTVDLIETTDTDSADGADVATYATFTGLTADSLTLSLESLLGGVGIGGIQIVGETSTGGFLAADFNQDTVVDLLDLDILGANWQTGNALPATGDANGDSVVDLLDLDILGSQWQQSSAAFEAALAASSITVPEPAALSILAGGLLLLRRRR